MASDIYLFSSSLPSVLVVTIWFLVFQFIIFRVYLTFVEAVILILKHATFLQAELQHSNSEDSALNYAESDYQRANMNLTIQQHLMASSSGHTIKEFVSFIMATDIGSFILASVSIVSH